jgi:hypothetical protein
MQFTNFLRSLYPGGNHTIKYASPHQGHHPTETDYLTPRPSAQDTPSPNTPSPDTVPELILVLLAILLIVSILEYFTTDIATTPGAAPQTRFEAHVAAMRPYIESHVTAIRSYLTTIHTFVTDRETLEVVDLVSRWAIVIAATIMSGGWLALPAAVWLLIVDRLDEMNGRDFEDMDMEILGLRVEMRRVRVWERMRVVEEDSEEEEDDEPAEGEESEGENEDEEGWDLVDVEE